MKSVQLPTQAIYQGPVSAGILSCTAFTSSPSSGLGHSSPDPQAQGCLGHTAGRQAGHHLPPLTTSHRVCGCALDRAHGSTPPPPLLPSLVRGPEAQHGGRSLAGFAWKRKCTLQPATSGEFPPRGAWARCWAGGRKELQLASSRGGQHSGQPLLSSPAGQHAALAHYSRSTLRSTLPTHGPSSFWT